MFLRFHRGQINWSVYGEETNYSLMGNNLSRVRSHNGLGICVDVQLTFYRHIGVVVDQAFGLITY